MTSHAPEWLSVLRAQASQPPLRPRVPLWAANSEIGSVEADFFDRIGLKPPQNLCKLLLKTEQSGAVAGWHVLGDLSESLNQLAALLYQSGLSGAWRDEQLAVHDLSGQQIGTVERAAVRPLGIATRAVHLVGIAPDGCFWVQQRAFEKDNDPGLWDTLMGGMVSSLDSLETALERETREEAGLELSQLQDMRHGGQVVTARPSRDGKGAGYMRETIDWYCCTVPSGVEPVNQDGEVEQFCRMTAQQLVDGMQQGIFTLEASLIQADVLQLT